MKNQTQADAVMYFIRQMDIEMLNELLDDHIEYQDKEKWLFLHMLDDAFDRLKKGGNTFLEAYGGHCNRSSCNYLCKGYSFIGNNDSAYLDLVIAEEQGRVKDIYECSGFICTPIAPVEKGVRIKIDKYEVRF